MAQGRDGATERDGDSERCRREEMALPKCGVGDGRMTIALFTFSLRFSLSLLLLVLTGDSFPLRWRRSRNVSLLSLYH